MKDTNIISSMLYPLIKASLDKNSKRFQDNIAKFFNKRHNEIFDIAPYDRIYFNTDDVNDFYRSLGITEQQVINIVKDCFFWNIDINPRCIKEPYIMVLLCCIRYYLIKGDRKHAELTSIYLAFTGKIYASLHWNFWKKYPPRKSEQVMDYVINNMLSDKFDLKREGNIFKAIQKLCITWLNTYESQIKKCDSDDDWKAIIQQLRDRVKSFLKNISDLFYKAYEEKLYLNYETDDLDTDNFRLTDNDAAMASRITEATMSVLTSQKVNMEICNNCKNENVSSLEIKNIVENILTDSENLPDIRRVINIIVCDFMETHPNKRVGSIEFISYTLKAKPNTKSKILLEMKEIIVGWLNQDSNYRRRKSRTATANNYYKSILGYFTLIISKVAMNL